MLDHKGTGQDVIDFLLSLSRLHPVHFFHDSPPLPLLLLNFSIELLELGVERRKSLLAPVDDAAVLKFSEKPKGSSRVRRDFNEAGLFLVAQHQQEELLLNLGQQVHPLCDEGLLDHDCGLQIDDKVMNPEPIGSVWTWWYLLIVTIKLPTTYHQLTNKLLTSYQQLTNNLP
eukprot:jgi/Psemu1/14684/gm1.14684_g